EPSLARILDCYAEQMLEQLPPRDDLAARVRHAIAGSLSEGERLLQSVAARLHMTPRTMQRRLSREGLSLRALVDQSRHELALRHMAQPGLSIAGIGYLLRFEQVSSFHRAFRRRT